MDTPFIVLDIETTGLSSQRDGITEIAAVKVHQNEIIDRFHTLINPKRPIPSFITRLTGITDAMVADAPTIAQVLPGLQEFLGEHIIVAHNASFDARFIAHNLLLHHGCTLDNPILCTRKLANRLVDIPKKRLSDLCDHYGLTNDVAHRAMSDVLATKDILLCMITTLRERGVATSAELLAFQDMPKYHTAKVLMQR